MQRKRFLISEFKVMFFTIYIMIIILKQNIFIQFLTTWQNSVSHGLLGDG